MTLSRLSWIESGSVFRNVSIVGASRVVPAALAFAQSVIVARLLGPEAFGTIALIGAYPSFVFGIFDVRTSDTTTRFTAGYDASNARVRALAFCKLAYTIDLTVAALALAVVVLTAPFVGPRVLPDSRLTVLMIVYATGFLPNAFLPTSNSILVIAGRFASSGTLDVARAVLRAALVIGFVLAGFGVPGFVFGTVIANAVVGVVTLVIAHREAGRRWGGSWLSRKWAELAGHRREIARFFVLSDLSVLFTMAIKTADVLILSQFCPTVEIGYYGLGKSLTGQLLRVVNSIRVVAFPEIVRLWAIGAWTDLWAYVRSHTVLFAGLGVAGVTALMLVIEPVVAAVYGPAFTPGVPVIRLLLCQVDLLFLTMWIDMVFMAWGDMHVLVLCRALGAIVTTGGIYLFAPRWGVAAGAFALLAQQSLSAVITFAWMRSQRDERAREAAGRRAVQPHVRSALS